MAHKRQGSLYDNIKHESARADKAEAVIAAAARASFNLIEAAIFADPRAHAYYYEMADGIDPKAEARAWRDYAMQTLSVLRAQLSPVEGA